VEKSKYIQFIHKTVSLIAILLGLVTVITGYRVLTGVNPGYNVFLPLLIFNVVMGFVYIVTGITSWRNPTYGKYLAATIFILNLLVLGIISYLHVTEVSVAIESVGAMSFRTTIWLVLLLGLNWKR